MQKQISCILKCEQHAEEQVIAIHLGEKQIFKCRFICLKCILSLQIKPEYILPIQDFMDDNLYPKIEQFESHTTINMKDWFEKIEHSIIEFEIVIQNYFKDIRDYIEKYKKKFNKLVKEKIQQKYNQNLIKLQMGIDSHKDKILQLLNMYHKIKELAEFPDLQLKITNGKKITYDLIYQGTKDGLQSESYWQKCNLKSNLLTIMTSQNGNIFGSYSPCQLNKDLATYVQDASLKSFLFQYGIILYILNNKKEIYPLKKKEYAIWCRHDYGPCYGYQCDVVVSHDFQGGHSSSLQANYDTSKYNIQDQSTHLFGDKIPQLVECKVYKVIQE